MTSTSAPRTRLGDWEKKKAKKEILGGKKKGHCSYLVLNNYAPSTQSHVLKNSPSNLPSRNKLAFLEDNICRDRSPVLLLFGCWFSYAGLVLFLHLYLLGSGSVMLIKEGHITFKTYTHLPLLSLAHYRLEKSFNIIGSHTSNNL